MRQIKRGRGRPKLQGIGINFRIDEDLYNKIVEIANDTDRTTDNMAKHLVKKGLETIGKE